MKVWRFYLKPEKNSERRKYELYAITNNKKFAEKFMKERDMDKFVMKCTKETKEEYAEFANNNLTLVLGMRTYLTKMLDSNNNYRTKDVDILSTEYEEQSCDSDFITMDIMTEGEWEYAPPYNIYKNKIIKALRKLEYVSSYKLYRSEYDATFIDPNDDDYSAPDLWIDELGIFLRTFGGTFKS